MFQGHDIADELYKSKCPECGQDTDEIESITAKIERLTEDIAKLRAQLPDTMQDCTIQYKSCPKGHGRLTATNWTQHGCKQCELEQLYAEVRDAHMGGWFAAAATFECKSNLTDESHLEESAYEDWKARVSGRQKNTNDRGVVESIEDVLKQIHWECGREDQTPEKIISTIIDLCNFGLDDELRSASCFSCGKKPCECHRNTNDSGQEYDDLNPNAIVAALTWENVADKMKGQGSDPDDCTLADVMCAARKVARAASPNQKDSDNG